MNQIICPLHFLLDPFRFAFARPEVFRNFSIVIFAWIVCLRPRRLTELWHTAGQVPHSHVDKVFRLFNDAVWDWDDIGFQNLEHLCELGAFPNGVLTLVIDDTLCHKRGAHVAFGGMQRDPVLSSKNHKVLRFGVNFVVLAAVVSIPGREHQRISLPLLSRPVRPKPKPKTKPETESEAPSPTPSPTEPDSDAKPEAKLPHRTKPQLAQEMLTLLANRFPNLKFRLLCDQAYINQAVLKNRPANVEVVGPLLGKAALYKLPPKPAKSQRGRPRKRGARLPNPNERLKARKDFKNCTVKVYGERKNLRVRDSRQELWPTGAGEEVVRVVSIHDPEGKWTDTTLLVTDPSLTTAEVIEAYSDRFSIETTFRDVKQHLGFHDPQVRVEKSVTRAHATAFFVYTLTWLWYLRNPNPENLLVRERPWYPQKETPTFIDVLSGFRLECWEEQIMCEWESCPDQRAFVKNLLKQMAFVG